jgi:aspartyl-tRNA(Asn)/glutamyl-tRNA(Gln) amidotransferase subunit B
MRSKETEADYRYFRDPDLLSAQLTPAWKQVVLATLPELPLARRSRFITEYGLSAYDAAVLTDERALSDYYETTVKLLRGNAKAVANWMMNDILRVLNESGASAADLVFRPEHLAETIQQVDAGAINRATGTSLIARVIATGRTPAEIIAAEGLAQISGDDALTALAQSVLDENPQQIEAYRKKPALLKWFVGQAMRKSQGKANAQSLEKAFLALLPPADV